MFDIFLESAGSIAAAVIFITVLRGIRHPSVRAQPGTRQVIIGFGLLLFSFIIDITDNFPSLNHLMVIGDTQYQAMLEKVFGMLLGLSFLAIGFRRWIPSIHKLADAQGTLDQLNIELKYLIEERTQELARVNQRLTIEVSERRKAEKQLMFQAQYNALAEELREALEKERLYLHYQPLMTADNRAFGVEALLRWEHPIRGHITPDEFIPLAEEAGFIDKIGQYVLQRTLADWGQFFADSGSENSIKLSVNISPSHFLQNNFVNQIRNLLSAYEMRHCQLVLEITESVAVQDVSVLSEKMEALQQIGVGISLDDFGTGYSSLAYIQQLPFDALKIDRSFVCDIHRDPNDAAIVEAVLAMAKALDVDVIAEGVETKEQRDFLRLRGCNLYQGYYFSRPALQTELIAQGLFR